jgi:hypothetical protein
MKTIKFSLNINHKTAKAPNSSMGADLTLGKTDFRLAPDAAARRTHAICEAQGSQPGHEAKHWLEAGAQLFGGVERETQLRPGSSLFTTEH